MRWLNAQSQPTLVWRTSAKPQKKKKASFVDEGGRGRESGEKKKRQYRAKMGETKERKILCISIARLSTLFCRRKKRMQKTINAPVFTHSRCCVHESTQVRVVRGVVVGMGVEMRGGG